MLIDKFGHSKSVIVTWIVSIILYIMLVAIFWSLRTVVDARMPGGMFDFRGIKSMFMSMSSLFIMIMLVEIVLCIVKIPTGLKMCLSIFENGVSGVAGKNFYFMSEAFEIPYSDILNVKLRFSVITIETTTRTYKCVVERQKEAFKLLQDYVLTNRN